ncbi:WXG100 family type VII secretion target [Plantactinospora sp. GCM10030261]|uniref:WXG100 family type VII secretion target n=1 Tax=Plantactinospora sp. GCM10030261 TaxID=3273420 RepID=UPI00361CFD81
MSDVFSYDESTAGSAQGDIASVANGVQASLDDLSNFVSRVKSNWDGDEMEIYHGIQAQWDGAAATVKQILDSVKQALGQTTTSVQEMRGQVRGTLQG